MNIRARLVIFLLVGVVLGACGGETPSPSATTVGSTAVPVQTFVQDPAPTATALPPPTPSPEPPAAARVNGHIITLENFQKELARYEAAQRTLGNDPTGTGSLYHVDVLNYLVEQVLIEQAAAAAGVIVSDQAVDSEVQRLIDERGEGDFHTWLEANQYSVDEFRSVLRSQMITQAMIEKVTASVTDTDEQVHARHIVVGSVETGEAILSQLQGGAEFAALAASYSLDESTRPNGGDLGFFPRGLLLSPEVEEAAFELEIGATSGLVESGFGYHIIQVLEKDPARAMPPDVQQRLRSVLFEDWLEQLWSTATVERNI